MSASASTARLRVGDARDAAGREPGCAEALSWTRVWVEGSVPAVMRVRP